MEETTKKYSKKKILKELKQLKFQPVTNETQSQNMVMATEEDMEDMVVDMDMEEDMDAVMATDTGMVLEEAEDMVALEVIMQDTDMAREVLEKKMKRKTLIVQAKLFCLVKCLKKEMATIVSKRKILKK